MSPTNRRRPQPTLPPPARKATSLRRWAAFLAPMVVIAVLIAIFSASGSPGSATPEKAPAFNLTDTTGNAVTLDSVLAGGDALLYFSMGVGCDGCFEQIPEITADLQGRGITLVSIMVDDPQAVAAEAARFGITTPIFIDQDRSVSTAYGMIGVYGHGDRPSHSFALVGQDGTVKHTEHYATMFVPLDQLLSDLGLS